MAKRRRSTSTAIVRAIPFPQRAPAPVIRIAAPRAIAGPKKTKRHHRRSSVGGSSLSGKTLIGVGIGGAVLGFLEKTFPTMPTVPLIGRAGTIAIAAYFLNKNGGMGHGGLVRDVALSGAAIAGYQLGKQGSISGDVEGDVDGDDSDVRGIAAQV